MRTILVALACASLSFASEAEDRARACYNISMDEPGAKGEPSNVIRFDTSSLAKAQTSGEWRTVQVCNNDGTGCHLEQRWFPAQPQVTDRPLQGHEISDGINDALDELNAQRAQRGLRPYLRDHGLTIAAQSCANARARALHFGHCGGPKGDFAALPQGTQASSSGCAAWYPGEGFGACGVYDNYTYAGAAYSMGSDGKRYMHAFYR